MPPFFVPKFGGFMKFNMSCRNGYPETDYIVGHKQLSDMVGVSRLKMERIRETKSLGFPAVKVTLRGGIAVFCRHEVRLWLANNNPKKVITDRTTTVTVKEAKTVMNFDNRNALLFLMAKNGLSKNTQALGNVLSMPIGFVQ